MSLVKNDPYYPKYEKWLKEQSEKGKLKAYSLQYFEIWKSMQIALEEEQEVFKVALATKELEIKGVKDQLQTAKQELQTLKTHLSRATATASVLEGRL